MLLILIFFFIGLILGIYKYSMSFGIYKDGVDVPFFTLIFTTIGIIIATIGGNMVDKEYKTTKNIEIVALSDGSNVDGSFFLGIGSIDNQQYYFFYEKTEDGFKQNKISVDNAFIVEDDNAFIEKKEKKFIDQGNKKWFIDMSVEKNFIHVPKGSIKRNFVLDLN